MSIISTFQIDDSAALAKQFAVLTAGYIDHPPDPKKDPAALVPLENLFRILEMFRYDAFGDESRGGVLAIEEPGQRYKPQFRAQPWHAEIVKALDAALAKTFGAEPKESAIEELQGGLRELAKSHSLTQARASRAKAFLVTFESQLA